MKIHCFHYYPSPLTGFQLSQDPGCHTVIFTMKLLTKIFHFRYKNHLRCPDVRIQFDHLESELIFQPSDGKTELFSAAAAGSNQKLKLYIGGKRKFPV